MTPRDDAPSLSVLVTGGVAVAVVIGFVVALALGGGSQSTPGERVAVVADAGPSGVAVLAGRCREQRVRSVTVRTGHDVRWRVESRKGSIDRRFSVGGEPPIGFEVTVPFAGSLDGPAAAEIEFDRRGHDPETDAREFDRSQLTPDADQRLGQAAPPCGGQNDLSGTVVLFAVGAAVVAAGYLVMVGRWLGGRRP